MYRVAICEDEKLLRQELRELTEKILLDLDISGAVTVFASAEALEAAFADPDTAFDLLLLDIQLEGKSGLELALERRRIGDWVSIIFTTGCEDYLRAGYKAQPLQYLLKPVAEEELREAIWGDWKRRHAEQTILLREGVRTTVMPVQDVLYLESINHGVLAHLTDRETFFHISLTDMAAQLPPGIFCRCHNSYLIHLGHVVSIGRADVRLHGDISIPVGRKYYTGTQSALIHYMNVK